MISPLMYSPALPYMFYSKPPSLGVQRTLDQSVEDYYDWGNLKKNIALNLAASGLENGGTDSGNALGMALATYLGLTVGEKAARWYNRRLSNLKENHPGFGHFVNSHPVLGNALAWLPGAGLVLGTGAGAFILGSKLWNTPWMRRIAQTPAFRTAAMVAVGLGLLATSFWGKLAKNGVGEVMAQGRDYRQARKDHPDLTPARLKQQVRAARNQAYLDAYRRQEQEKLRAQLDPNYGEPSYAAPQSWKPSGLRSFPAPVDAIPAPHDIIPMLSPLSGNPFESRLQPSLN